MNIVISLAGIPVEIVLNHPENADYFKEFISEEIPLETIALSDDEIKKQIVYYPEGTKENYVEFNELSYIISKTLLKYGMCIFHGTAFVWKENAWIFAAPSGTGKTTQYFLWKMLLGNQVTMLNGDKPILKCEGQKITVHTSPWKGKEGMHNPIIAPLGGIVYLKQSDKNRVEIMSPKSSIIPLMRQFHLDNTEDILSACDILEKILEEVPIWFLENVGDEESARLMIKAIEFYMENKRCNI